MELSNMELVQPIWVMGWFDDIGLRHESVLLLKISGLILWCQFGLTNLAYLKKNMEMVQIWTLLFILNFNKIFLIYTNLAEILIFARV
jgi:hypothetical protein